MVNRHDPILNHAAFDLLQSIYLQYSFCFVVPTKPFYLTTVYLIFPIALCCVRQ